MTEAVILTEGVHTRAVKSPSGPDFL